MTQYKEWLISFGTKLRNERERQKLTRAALAERIGTKHDYIAQLERGDKSPSMRTMLNLLAALDVSPEFLLPNPNKKLCTELDSILNDFTEFLKQQEYATVVALYEITRTAAQYVNNSSIQKNRIRKDRY